VASPPVTVASTLPVTSVTELRTSLEVPVISNPNALGSASELVDICILEGPDGRRRRVRVIYDSGATDTVVDFIGQLLPYSRKCGIYLKRSEYNQELFNTHWQKILRQN
jgi:hypothetical protein